MKKIRFDLLCAGALMCAAVPQQVWAAGQEQSQAQQEAERHKQLDALRASLHPQSGQVSVPGVKATLNLGREYYFLPAAEAKRVLTEGWGNPPDAVEGVLGMIFPAGKQFDDETWGAVVEYEDNGHISDKDAASEDYDKVLADMKSGEAENNKELKEQGYPTSITVGWAQKPTYDSSRKVLIWARDIKFDGVDHDTLNYDVRTLGRTGVLSMNMVDSMDHLPQIRSAAAELGDRVQFNPGARYADFNSSTDKLADYGLAGLVAGGAGLLVAKKVGLLGVVLLFLKKAIVLLVAAAGGLIAWFKRRFGRSEA
jgi:uncharacterized membrane-anchored protein